MRRLVVVLTAVVALAFAGCASDDKGSDSSAGDAPAAAGKTVKLEAVEFTFTPTEIALDPGASTLEVTNSDKVKHNITIADLDVDVDLDGGAVEKVPVDAKAGTYEFHCEYHPDQMKGTITVG